MNVLTIGENKAVMSDTIKIPLFPINMSILPEEKVPLHIFEERYKKMINKCLKNKSSFGIIYKNKEKLHEIGTTVKIIKVYKKYDDGRYDLLVEGQKRFKVVKFIKNRSLWQGEIIHFDEEYDKIDTIKFSKTLDKYLKLLLTLNIDHDIQSEINKSKSFDFTKNILIPTEIKQEFLELFNEEERIDYINDFLESIIQKSKKKNINIKKGKLLN